MAVAGLLLHDVGGFQGTRIVPLAILDAIAARYDSIGEVRGIGPMLAFEFADRTPERAAAVVSAAFDDGLLLLACGVYGNVIRLLPPLTISDADLDEGMAILEKALASSA